MGCYRLPRKPSREPRELSQKIETYRSAMIGAAKRGSDAAPRLSESGFERVSLRDGAKLGQLEPRSQKQGA